MPKKLPRGIQITASGRYGARFKNKGKAYWVGSFDTLDEAVAARKEMMDRQGAVEQQGVHPKNYNDLTGRTFNHLTVLGDSGKRSGLEVLWHCQCDCGNTINVRGVNLKNGTTKSCGHIKSDNKRMNDKNQKLLKKYRTNPYRLDDTPPSNNTSGVRGVSIHAGKTGKRYIVNLTIKGTRIYGGSFETLNEAIEVRKQLELSYWKNIQNKFNKEDK